MPSGNFDSFRAELLAIRGAVGRITKKTVRDDDLRERIRTLFRIWISSVKPSIETMASSQKEILKLTAELEALAGLANKIMRVADYLKRIKRSIELADQVVLFIPAHNESRQGETTRGKLFLEEIPDLPLDFVPNALLGWREDNRSFLHKHPFDNSIFLMVRYRARNDDLIQAIKKFASRHGYHIVLARDHRLTDDLYNPIACLLSCAKGLAVFDEPEDGQKFNPNVAYELGMMHLLGRDCRVLKHASLDVLLTDIHMKLYHEYSGLDEAAGVVDEWLGSPTT